MTDTAHTSAGSSNRAGRAVAVFSANVLLVLVVFWSVVTSTTVIAGWAELTTPLLRLGTAFAQTLWGVLLSLAIALVLSRIQAPALLPRALQALAIALPAALLHAALVLYLQPGDSGAGLAGLFRAAAASYWIYSAWGVLFLLVSIDDQAWDWRDLFSGLSRPAEHERELDELRRRLIPESSAYKGLNAKWFWSFQAVFWSLKLAIELAGLLNIGEAISELWRPLMADLGGVAMTAGAHYVLLRQTQALEMTRRIILALLVALVSVGVYVLLLWVAWFQLAPVEVYAQGELVDTGWAYLAKTAPRDALLNIAFFVGWAGFYLALDTARRMRHQEQQLYSSIMMAQDAQLKMLRFQINPHFLFNTLNAISTLVMDQRNEEAETMLIRLSRFLRFTLDAEPEDRVTLSNELDAQELYLEIERARFQERLDVEIDAEPDTLDAAIPSLLLQPIVENTIKHGVSNSSNRVEIRIRVRRQGEELHIEIQDNGEVSSPQPHKEGGGVGLQNVRRRLSVIYGARASLQAAPVPGGGFKVAVQLPFELHRPNNDNSIRTD